MLKVPVKLVLWKSATMTFNYDLRVPVVINSLNTKQKSTVCMSEKGSCQVFCINLSCTLRTFNRYAQTFQGRHTNFFELIIRSSNYQEKCSQWSRQFSKETILLLVLLKASVRLVCEHKRNVYANAIVLLGLALYIVCMCKIGANLCAFKSSKRTDDNDAFEERQP